MTFEDYTAQFDVEMTAADVIKTVRLLEARGVRVHVDGGWAVDALL